MTAKTTTVRVYPADAQRLDEVRRYLQRNDGNDRTIADAIKFALDRLYADLPIEALTQDDAGKE